MGTRRASRSPSRHRHQQLRSNIVSASHFYHIGLLAYCSSPVGGGVLLTWRALGPRHYSINPWASLALRGGGLARRPSSGINRLAAKWAWYLMIISPKSWVIAGKMQVPPKSPSLLSTSIARSSSLPKDSPFESVLAFYALDAPCFLNYYPIAATHFAFASSGIPLGTFLGRLIELLYGVSGTDFHVPIYSRPY